MENKKLNIYKMKDKFDSLKVPMGELFDIPMKLLIVGKSELSGKSNFIGNLLLRDEFYKNKFEGDNIVIVCPSTNLDYKWNVIIKEHDIPESNIYRQYDEDQLEVLYDLIKEEYHEDVEDKKKPKHWCIIFDDISYGGSLKKHKYGIISKLASNGRHLLISTIITAQKYTDVLTGFRENMTGGVFFSCTNKQLESIWTDHGLIPLKGFSKMFRDITNPKHSFLIINYSNNMKERYMDSDFKPIDVEKYTKK